MAGSGSCKPKCENEDGYGRGEFQGENSLYVFVYLNDLKKLTIIQRLMVLKSHHTKSYTSYVFEVKILIINTQSLNSISH